MSVQENQRTTPLIERICGAHSDRDPDGPLVTRMDGVWAYCAGHRDTDHEWRTIEPVTREHLESARH